MNLFNALKILSLLLTINLACANPPQFDQISQQQLLQKTVPVQLILDVRTPEEFSQGHVPGAQNIPYDQVPNRLDEIIKLSGDKNAPIAVYCRSGRRAGKALTTLKASGFMKLFHLQGDMNAWQASKLPIEK